MTGWDALMRLHSKLIYDLFQGMIFGTGRDPST